MSFFSLGADATETDERETESSSSSSSEEEESELRLTEIFFCAFSVGFTSFGLVALFLCFETTLNLFANRRWLLGIRASSLIWISLSRMFLFSYTAF